VAVEHNGAGTRHESEDQSIFSNGSSAFFDLTGQLLIPATIVAVGFWRGARARARGDDERIRAWTKRAYWCFLVWGAFLILSVPLLYRIERLPAEQQEGGTAMFGFLLGVPAVIVFLVGAFHAVAVWRGKWVRLLLFPTAVAAGFFFYLDDFRTEPLDVAPWDTAGAGVYALVVLVASISGLRQLRRGGGLS
jgi:hypothetical protein